VTLVLDSVLQEVSDKANQVDALEVEKTNLNTEITSLKKTVAEQKVLLDDPAEEIKNVVTDEIDSTGKKSVVVDEFETSYDREARKAFGK
jgi:hypothetical protein